MTRKFRLEKDDCEDIGFALTCLIAGAISCSEFKEWIYLIIENSEVDDVPSYMFELLDLGDSSKLEYLQTVGFTPHWDKSAREDDAIDAIAYRRRRDFVSDAVDRDAALQALAENPHIERRFRDTFPFIELPE